MRILLTGKNGQLGWELYRLLERDYEVLAIGREDIDFCDVPFFVSTLGQLPKLDLIVNAAAYTDIDKAAQEPHIAEAINSEAAAILAAEADYRGIPMIHFSTDHVFGRRRIARPFLEDDQPYPCSVYAATKLDGELRIRSILEKHLIFRLSGLYGCRRKNFYTAMLNHYRKGTVPRVACDRIISPNWTPLVAEAIVGAIDHLFWGGEVPWGTYHLSGSGSTTPYKFARLVFENLGNMRGNGTMFPIPGMTKKGNGMAARPKYSVLDSSRFSTVFEHSLPDWQEQLQHFIGELNQEAPRVNNLSFRSCCASKIAKQCVKKLRCYLREYATRTEQ